MRAKKTHRRLAESARKDRKCFQELREAEIERWLLRRRKAVKGGFTTDEKYRLKTGFFDRLKRDPSNKEEFVTTEDLSGPLLSLGMAKNQRELEDVLKRIDLEGTGNISFDRFLRIVQKKKHGKKKTKKLNAIVKLQRQQGRSHLTLESLLSIKRRRHLLRSIMPKYATVTSPGEHDDNNIHNSKNEQRHQDLKFIKSISSVVAKEIDKYPEWNITRSFECENRISPLESSSLESSLTLFDAQKFRVPTRRLLEKISNDAQDNVSAGSSKHKKLSQDFLTMKKNRYYAYGFRDVAS